MSTDTKTRKIREKETEFSHMRFTRMVHKVFGEEGMYAAARNLLAVERANTLSENEKDAVGQAMQEVGEYLEQIGKTDFVVMSEEEQDEFFRIFVVAYRCHIRKIVMDQAPF